MSIWGGIAKIGGTIAGGAAGFALGGPMGAAKGASAGYSLGSALAGSGNKKPATQNATDAEYNDLARQRQGALGQLQTNWNSPNLPKLATDPAATVNYSAPAVAARNTSLFDRATNMTRPANTIQNDALSTLQGMGQFNYADRPAAQMNGDTLDQIKGFTGDAASIARQGATSGYGMGGQGGRSALAAAMASGGGGVSSPEVQAMMERANVDELMNFDPSASFEKYATGAQGKQIEALNTANTKLTNTAAGGNRLNTGFFNLDAGEMGRQINTDFRNDLQSHALDTNAQKLAALTSGTTIRANDLDSLRGQYLDAQKSNASNQLSASSENARNRMQGYGMMIDDDNADANRDASFRTSSLSQLGNADDRRLTALTEARNQMVGDRNHVDSNYDTDRTAARTSFDNYGDRLGDIAKTQRGDQTRLDNQFGDDRDFLMKGQTTSDNEYQNDRDYALDAWGQENNTRFKGGDVARQDRDFAYKGQQDAQNSYLDFLSGSSDRNQGTINAANQTASNNQNSRNGLLGTLAGTAGGLLGSYLQKKNGGGMSGVTLRGTTNNMPVTRA